VWAPAGHRVVAATSRFGPGDRMYDAIKIVENDFFIGIVPKNETFPIF
jgi:hypothetical protein